MLRCLQTRLERYNEDGIQTETSVDQAQVEENVDNCFKYIRSLYEIDPDIPRLLRSKHLPYLRKGLFSPLPARYESLDASRPWLTYWITHAVALLGDQPFLTSCSKQVTPFLLTCRNSDGGYGGGPQQISHLAATYAVVNAIVTLNDEDALATIDRKLLLNFLWQMKQEDGSFTMHKDGESDVRGAYCAASVAYLCGINNEKLFEKTADWILSCQTYEGGFGATNDNEAHGGYTFCALAALVLLGQAHRCKIKSLLRWVVNRQYNYEGGFSGRTNKLVDSCYSFWQGACLPILHNILTTSPFNLSLPRDRWLFNQQALQEYLLCCCQYKDGGLIDKPGKPRDFYHTCYSLSGLSVAQHTLEKDTIVGPEANKLVVIHPLFNIQVDAVQLAHQFFTKPLV